MPTQPGIPSAPLDPKTAVAKFAGLISELRSQDDPATQDPEASPAPTPAEPAPTDTPATEPPASESDAETYEVKVDGEPVLVDLAELKAGYSRDADYRRKTMALADERRAFETESQSVQADRQRYIQGLQQVTAALQQLQGEPDWDQLHHDLPADEFLQRKADWERSRAHLEKLQRHQAEELQAAHEAQAATYQKYLRTEQDKLYAAIPEWSDATKAKAEREALIAGAKHYGYTEQEVQTVADHRAILILRDALKYRELHREPNVQTRTKVSTIKPAKPGTPERPRPNEKQQKLLERAAQTGRGRDAMDAIAALLPD
jgi:hypothetical protein